MNNKEVCFFKKYLTFVNFLLLTIDTE